MEWSQDHPLWFLFFLFAGIFLSASQLHKLRIDTSAEVMMIRDDPARELYQETLEKFGSDQIAVIFLQDKRLFTPAKMGALKELTFALEDVPGILKVDSLFTVNNIKSENGFLHFDPLCDFPPATLAEAQTVRKKALSNDILRKNLISETGEATTIILYLDAFLKKDNFIIRISERIEKVLEPYFHSFDTIFQLGNPYKIQSQKDTLIANAKTMFPISGILIIFLLVLTMRSWNAAFLPLLTSGFSILFTLGFMGFWDIPITILNAIVPFMLLVIGSTE